MFIWRNASFEEGFFKLIIVVFFECCSKIQCKLIKFHKTKIRLIFNWYWIHCISNLPIIGPHLGRNMVAHGRTLVRIRVQHGAEYEHAPTPLRGSLAAGVQRARTPLALTHPARVAYQACGRDGGRWRQRRHNHHHHHRLVGLQWRPVHNWNRN